eukprot:4191763-Prymnesium_polylepis.1
MGVSAEIHRELCRLMKYRKANKGQALVSKGMPVRTFFVMLSGTASSYADVDVRRSSLRRSSRLGGVPTNRTLPIGAAGAGGAGRLSMGGQNAQLASATLGVMRPGGGAHEVRGKSGRAIETFRMGDSIGEAELLEDGAIYETTIVTNESCELMEISEDDFNR